MERYMLHLANTGYGPADSRKLVHWARDLCKPVPSSVRVCRVATKFIELDVSVDPQDLDDLVGLLRPIGSIDNIRYVAEEEMPKDDGIRDGIFYYNSERFWEAHEAWEGVWKKCAGAEKLLVQGLILLAVSFAHRQKNDEAIGIRMLSRVREKIGDWDGKYHGIDIDRVRAKIAEMQSGNRLVPFQV